MDYKDAGVDIEKGDALVDWIKNKNQKGPLDDLMVSGVGGFASIMRFPQNDMKKPCLVSATDGIGTKLKLAIEFQRYEGLGQDLVAMCVNDLLCTGAKPLFFLDYYATGSLDLKQVQPFLLGLKKACDDVNCQLVGGETAEMPGMYQNGDFDCAGFAVGVVDEDQILGPHNVKEGARVLGVSSSGFHSNGYSLVRRLFEKDMSDWVDQLIKPTHLYGELLEGLNKSNLQAVAHVTGGGLNNIGRVIPKGLGLKLKTWELPALFQEAQKRSQLDNLGLLETFNCGVGLALILEASAMASAQQKAEQLGFKTYDLGAIEAGVDSIDYTHWS